MDNISFAGSLGEARRVFRKRSGKAFKHIDIKDGKGNLLANKLPGALFLARRKETAATVYTSRALLKAAIKNKLKLLVYFKETDAFWLFKPEEILDHPHTRETPKSIDVCFSVLLGKEIMRKKK